MNDKSHAIEASGAAHVRLPIRLKTVIQTCWACPSQWEGKTDDGRMFYARYRWGWLQVHLSEKPSDDVFDALDGIEIFSQRLGDGYAGLLPLSEFVEATRGVLNFPVQNEAT